MTEPLTIVPRGTKCERAFAWQSKRALRLIRGGKGKTQHRYLHLAVYQALTEIASDEEAAVFQCYAADIARKASMGVRSVFNVLPDLEACGVLSVRPIKIEGTKANDMSEYTLLAMQTRVKQPAEGSCTGNQTSSCTGNEPSSCTGEDTSRAENLNKPLRGLLKKKEDIIAEAAQSLGL